MNASACCLRFNIRLKSSTWACGIEIPWQPTTVPKNSNEVPPPFTHLLPLPTHLPLYPPPLPIPTSPSTHLPSPYPPPTRTHWDSFTVTKFLHNSIIWDTCSDYELEDTIISWICGVEKWSRQDKCLVIIIWKAAGAYFSPKGVRREADGIETCWKA